MINSEPSTQLNLYVHHKLLDNFINLYNDKRLPNKILLSGEKGIGKATLAYHLINYVLSINEDSSYDKKNYRINNENRSYKLIQNKINPNFYLLDIAKDKKNIDIDQIRDLIIDLNKSSFNSKPRFVLIDNIEYLNINSINALLKILEEPNENINFILINNNKKILPTLKSRCLDFKVSFSYKKSIEIINQLVGTNIFELVNKEIMNNYVTPGQIFELLKYSKDQKIDLKNNSLKEFLLLAIENKIYKKEKSINELLYYLIELYFRNNLSIKKTYLIDLYFYFSKKINSVKKYNLDVESLYIEFEDKVLNG
tara:strand:- start:1552 stop:2484 length:933 start_codon:yes stop_codon:yes gene_type:complete